MSHNATLSHQPSHEPSHQSRKSKKQSHAASAASAASHASPQIHESDEVASPLGGGAVDVQEIAEQPAHSREISSMFRDTIAQRERRSGKVETNARLTAQLDARQAQLQNVSMLPPSETSPQRANEHHLIAQTYMFMMHGGTLSNVSAPYPTEFEKIDYFSPRDLCATIDHAEMLTGFNTSQQRIDNIEYFLHGSEQCPANGKYAMLQPIGFTIGDASDQHVPYIGLYRYDFLGKIPANDGIDAIKASVRDIRVTKLVSFSQLDPTKVYTYTNLFSMVSADIKKILLRKGQGLNTKGLHVIFFCCRLPASAITLPAYPSVDTKIMGPDDFASFAETPHGNIDIQLLEVTMSTRPPMPTEHNGPLGSSFGLTHLTEQSCLLNLLAFYGFIPYDVANVMAVMMGSQQRTSLSTEKVIVAGESVRFFINAINAFLPQVSRRFIVERMSTVDGLQRIMNNIKKIAPLKTGLQYVWFVKLYTINLKPSKPGKPDVFSEIGHWISLWLDENGRINYVDPQGLTTYTGTRMSFYTMADAGDSVEQYPPLKALIDTYQMVDIVYVLTKKPSPEQSYLTGILYTVDQIRVPRFPKGGRRRSKKHKAAATKKTRCKKHK